MRPPLACTNCRGRKKKCNRSYPICSNCLKNRTRCSYRTGSNPDPPLGRLALQTPAIRSGDNLSAKDYTAAVFLDHSLFHKSPGWPPKNHFTIHSDLRRTLPSGVEQQQCLATFVNTINPWMSFIPPNDLRLTLASPVDRLSGEEALLLACIELATRAPAEADPRTKRYLMIKSAFVDSEITGVLSARLLQAQLLLVLYEYGHGIYPSAYFTLGTCVRNLQSLGIEGAGPSYCQSGQWIEQEIHRRLWWATFVMERCIALGCPERPLSLEEPDENRILPSDDRSWEQGKPSAQSSITMKSPLTPNMGNFRLIALASHLLGQVYKHLRDRQTQQEIYDERTTLLHRTICALINVLEEEGVSPIVSGRLPRSILNSATMLLFAAPSPSQARQGYVSEDPYTMAARSFVERSRVFLQGNLGGVDRVGPFLLHWGFQTFRYYYQAYTVEEKHETLEALQVLEDFFHQLEKRWKLAGVYTSLLSASL